MRSLLLSCPSFLVFSASSVPQSHPPFLEPCSSKLAGHFECIAHRLQYALRSRDTVLERLLYRARYTNRARPSSLLPPPKRATPDHSNTGPRHAHRCPTCAPNHACKTFRTSSL